MAVANWRVLNLRLTVLHCTEPQLTHVLYYMQSPLEFSLERDVKGTAALVGLSVLKLQAPCTLDRTMSREEAYPSYRYARQSRGYYEPDTRYADVERAPAAPARQYSRDPYYDYLPEERSIERVHPAYARDPGYARPQPSVSQAASYREPERYESVRRDPVAADPYYPAPTGTNRFRMDGRDSEYDSYHDARSREELLLRRSAYPDGPAYRRDVRVDEDYREVQPSYRRSAGRVYDERVPQPEDPYYPRRTAPSREVETLKPLAQEEVRERGHDSMVDVTQSPPRPSMSIFNMLNDGATNGASSTHSSPSKPSAERAAVQDSRTEAMEDIHAPVASAAVIPANGAFDLAKDKVPPETRGSRRAAPESRTIRSRRPADYTPEPEHAHVVRRVESPAGREADRGGFRQTRRPVSDVDAELVATAVKDEELPEEAKERPHGRRHHPRKPLRGEDPVDLHSSSADATATAPSADIPRPSPIKSESPAAARSGSGKPGLKLRNNPLPPSRDANSFVAPPPPPAKRKSDPDGWESDLSTEENRPVWTAELDDYMYDVNERMRLIENAFEDTLLEKRYEVEKRLARAYEGRHFAVFRRIRIREHEEATQRVESHQEDAGRQQRDHEIEMELLDTLEEDQLSGAKPAKPRKKGRGDVGGSTAGNEADDMVQQDGGDSDESEDVALADIAARTNGVRSNVIKLKRSKGKGSAASAADSSKAKRRRLADGAAASSPAPGSEADSAPADYPVADAELSRMRDGDESLLASRQGSPSLDETSYALDLDAHGKVPIDARRSQQLEDAHRRIWTNIAKRDIPKVYRTVQQSAASKTMYWRRLASVVQREAKRGAARNNKTVKDVQLRARKVMREVLVFWKKNEKEERELRKKAEREALEKAKKEEEMREAKRQARKLNFLISQTELYSHFVGSKLKTAEAEESEETAGSSKIIDPNAQPSNATVPPINPHSELADAEARLAELDDIDFDDEDETNLRAHAARNAQEAVRLAKEKAQAFDIAAAEERRRNEAAARERDGEGEADVSSGGRRIEEKDLGKAFDSDDMNFLNPTSMGQAEIKQPKMLTCQLKEYQLKGLNWLANLYEQGINGILADEMGLGKTVQSISLMAYLAEVHDIWGPFLVIAPASTLHNWQQEISKFVPTLKALPYWGNVKDRAVLRKFWNRKQISYNRDAPFHVLVTSYQLVVSDEKYFQRVKWQYMILDEAQAIKSSSSIRWKTLLGFNCRNRLLLTGTPVQNSMQELWALLHFIMPSLFDSHDEFSEWFSKDIESHAEQKGTLNEHQLRRLHMILKPFMLRRIKKNVQNELGDKIEIDVMCDLSARQKMLYRGLRSNISVAELMDRATSNDEAGLKSLMNLVMQFRKVCNHPELFERADVRAPFAFAGFAQSGSLAREGDLLQLPDSTHSLIQMEVPKLLVRDGGLLDVPGDGTRKGFDTAYLDNLFNVWRSAHIHDSLQQSRSAFAALPLVGVSPSDAEKAFHGDTLQQILREAAEERRWKSVETYAADSDFAASALRPVAKLLKPLPSNSGRSPSLLMPLEDVAADYRRHSYLVKDSARAVVTPAVAPPIRLYSNDRAFMQTQENMLRDDRVSAALFGLSPEARESVDRVDALQRALPEVPPQGLAANSSLDQLPYNGMQVPQMNKLIVDSSKMAKLDELLRDLKANGHRVLLYFQMTRMIDLMEEYLIYRQYKYLRLDGASKISDRRDMVTDWQTKPELFIFLLSTRAGGLGINLTAADTVIFYDHDWNPSNDSQAMDRAHRLGQTRQVTVYRLITKGTIDERIVRLARNKKEVQDIVVGNKAYTETGMAKPQEIVSLLLDDDELAESILRKKQAEEAQTAQEKADSVRAMHAKRRLNKDRAAAAAARSPAPTGLDWSLEDDEDDFFGARPPSKPDTDTAETTPQPQVMPKRKPGPAKRGRISEAASERMTPLDLDGDGDGAGNEGSPNGSRPAAKRKSKSHRKKTVDELAGVDF
ncbi:hypothetical protein BCV70DRAFT_208990 [Testicularia cyperi]|uniref:Chromatin-remodeling ATPase INO80 n=1 Tax=Testicularia cyperi TaxID=1882483 RepID=A0A317XI30_9BASI|nr:hypothetical protein BCV70DRAFT_208990 [Testicularia cyperi]